MRQRARIPAVTQNGAQGIAPLANLRGHIIGLVMNTFAELRPTGRKHIAADGLPIEMQLVHAQRRDIDHGSLDGLANAEVFSEVRRWQAFQIGNGLGPAPRGSVNDLGRSPSGILKVGLFPAVRRLLRCFPRFIDRNNQILTRFELQHQPADHCRIVRVGVTGRQSHRIHAGTQCFGHIQTGCAVPVHRLTNRHTIHGGLAEVIGIKGQHRATQSASCRQFDLSAQVALAAVLPVLHLYPLESLDVH